jgi:hypothetical protein
VGEHFAVTYERVGTRLVVITMDHTDRLADLSIAAAPRR